MPAVTACEATRLIFASASRVNVSVSAPMRSSPWMTKHVLAGPSLSFSFLAAVFSAAASSGTRSTWAFFPVGKPGDREQIHVLVPQPLQQAGTLARLVGDLQREVLEPADGVGHSRSSSLVGKRSLRPGAGHPGAALDGVGQPLDADQAVAGDEARRAAPRSSRRCPPAASAGRGSACRRSNRGRGSAPRPGSASRTRRAPCAGRAPPASGRRGSCTTPAGCRAASADSRSRACTR